MAIFTDYDYPSKWLPESNYSCSNRHCRLFVFAHCVLISQCVVFTVPFAVGSTRLGSISIAIEHWTVSKGDNCTINILIYCAYSSRCWFVYFIYSSKNPYICFLSRQWINDGDEVKGIPYILCLILFFLFHFSLASCRSVAWIIVKTAHHLKLISDFS